MKFLFTKTIVSKQGKCVYKIYEYMLAPGQYHAQLVHLIDPKAVARVNFKKENGTWRASSKVKAAKRLAEILGNEIEKSNN